MAPLPPLPADLSPETRAAMAHMGSARAHADGRAELGQVYVQMLHDVRLAPLVAAVGEEIRFHGVLPDDVRELVVLRFSARKRYEYEQLHHERPARLAGITGQQIDAVLAGGIPEDLRPDQRSAIRAADAVVDGVSIPEDDQQTIVAAYGTAGVVELVVTCGLYAIMGFMVVSFDIPVEPEIRSIAEASRGE